MILQSSVWFLIASLAQAAVVFTFETLGVSSLNPQVPLIVHVAIGQLAGYLLYFAVRNYEAWTDYSSLLLGALYGSILWVVVLSIASTLGRVTAPWSQGAGTVAASLAAFVLFGVISSIAVKRIVNRSLRSS